MSEMASIQGGTCSNGLGSAYFSQRAVLSSFDRTHLQFGMYQDITRNWVDSRERRCRRYAPKCFCNLPQGVSSLKKNDGD
jgi:hypothetical protein